MIDFGIYFRLPVPHAGRRPGSRGPRLCWDLRTWPGVNDLVGIREVSGLGSYIRTAAAKPFARTELT